MIRRPSIVSLCALVPTLLLDRTEIARSLTVVGHEKVGGQCQAWVHPVFVEVGHAAAGQEGVIDDELSGELLRRRGKDLIGRIGQNVRRPALLHHLVAADDIPDRRCCDGRARPQGVDRNAF